MTDPTKPPPTDERTGAALRKLPPGWHYIAPADTRAGDCVVDNHGSIHLVPTGGLDALPVELRRRAYAIRYTPG